MSAARDAFKLNEAETMTLLRLYSKYPCLYDSSDPQYKNRKARLEALDEIAREIRRDGFGPAEIVSKIKNVRNGYSQELKKMYNSQKEGRNYTPKVYWFKFMDSFLRRQMYVRHPQYSIDLSNGNSSDCERMSTGDSLDEELVEPEVELSQMRCSIEIMDPPAFFDCEKQPSEVANNLPNSPSVNEPTHKRILPPTEPQTKKEKLDVSIITEAAEKINQAALQLQNKKCDMYDHFGNFVAEVLRNAGGSKAISITHDITKILMTHVEDQITVTSQFKSEGFS